MIIEEVENPCVPKSSGVERSEGWHVTDIINDMYKQLYPKAYQGEDWNMDLAAELGFAGEKTLEGAFGEKLGIRPGELEKDGIIGSPDGIDFARWKVIEIKLTWRSFNEDPQSPRWWKWRAQAMAYAYMLGQMDGKWPEIEWHVIYIAGDWKGGGPKYKVFRGIATGEELEANWKMLLRHKERVESG